MAGIQEISQYLNDKCTTGTAADGAEGTGLTAVHQLVFDHRKHITKADSIKDLAVFYADERNIFEVWDKLSECERDFVSYIVRYDGKEYLPSTIEYAKKYNFALEYHTKWGAKRSILDDYEYSNSRLKFLSIINKHIPKTKAAIFFPSGKDMPPFVLDILKKVVEPMKFEYGEYVKSAKDYIICRENKIGDFAAVVRFAGSENMKVKDGTFEITKAKLAKMVETIKLEEVCDDNGRFCTPKEPKRSSDFKVALPVFVLAVNAGLLEIDMSGNVLPGRKSIEWLALPHNKLAKKIFDSYVHDNKIYEFNYIPYITTYDGDSNIAWHLCRKPIIDLLKTCPVDKFVKFDDLEKYAKIFCGNFFRKNIHCDVMIKGYKSQSYNYYNYYGRHTPDWDECEAQLIRLILSFLCALGMIDIAYTEKVERIKDNYNDFCIGIAGVRITKLGAWILGMADEYETPESISVQNAEGEILVQPDYSVIISGLKVRIEHETYLSKFLTKISIDENAAIYKIDFQSIIRAFDNGITPQKIKVYLKKSISRQLPENVERSLDDWQAKVGRVKIQNITVIETDDNLLLEEIKHIKGMDNIIISTIKNAVIINSDAQRKAKKLIENTGLIVKI